MVRCMCRLCRWVPLQQRLQERARTAPAPTSGASSSAMGLSWQSGEGHPPLCTSGICSKRSASSRCASPSLPFITEMPARESASHARIRQCWCSNVNNANIRICHLCCTATRMSHTPLEAVNNILEGYTPTRPAALFPASRNLA